MIYVDSSVALAHLLVEERHPPAHLWDEELVSSRLLQYEVWTRVHAHGLAQSHGDSVRQLLARFGLVEMTPPVLARVLEPFPLPVRTLDALHLASLEFLRAQGRKVELATYDERMLAAARRMDIAISSMSPRR